MLPIRRLRVAAAATLAAALAATALLPASRAEGAAPGEVSVMGHHAPTRGTGHDDAAR